MSGDIKTQDTLPPPSGEYDAEEPTIRLASVSVAELAARISDLHAELDEARYEIARLQALLAGGEPA